MKKVYQNPEIECVLLDKALVGTIANMSELDLAESAGSMDEIEVW